MKEHLMRMDVSPEGTLELLLIDSDMADEEIDRDAANRRIIACVNACHGIPVQDLEGIAAFSKNGQSILKKLTKTLYQRDNLLKAVRHLIEPLKQVRNSAVSLPLPVYAKLVDITKALHKLPEKFD